MCTEMCVHKRTRAATRMCEHVRVCVCFRVYDDVVFVIRTHALNWRRESTIYTISVQHSQTHADSTRSMTIANGVVADDDDDNYPTDIHHCQRALHHMYICYTRYVHIYRH